MAENPRQVKETAEPEREKGARPKEHRRPLSDRRTSQIAKETREEEKDLGSSERQESRIAKEETVAKKANKSSQGRYQEKEN